ncbi:MULE transposase domain [Sesbania bispinosa]|nr:MULE transposase domain [Sesbania bispinosa]
MDPFAHLVIEDVSMSMGMEDLSLSTQDGNDFRSEHDNQGEIHVFVVDEGGSVFLVDEDSAYKSATSQEEIPTDSANNNDHYGDGFFVEDDLGGAILVDSGVFVNVDNLSEGDGNVCGEEKIAIDSEDDIRKLGDLSLFSPHEIVKYDFANIDVANAFYKEYAGAREDKGLRMEERVREPRSETRCGCLARFQIHINKNSTRWYCTWFDDDHNHERLGPVHCRMLPAYRRMTDSDIVQMNNMMKVGIRPPHIFNAFANQAGGYEKIGFRKKDIYNKINEQRRKLSSNAKGAIQYLGELRLMDNMMYFEHTVDEEGRLQHLFWSDGVSQQDYLIFGDVLAFDATYGKNKYMMSLVVFSGVNHHNRSTIFAATVIANETEETYV